MATEPWSAVFLDPALEFIKLGASHIAVCSAKPVNYTQAMSTYKLASTTVSSGDFTGPVDGLVSGRRLVIAAKTAVSVTASGTTRYIAIVNSSTTALLYVRKTAQIAITVGNTVDILSTGIELRDPIL